MLTGRWWGREWCARWRTRHPRPGAAGRVAAESARCCRADPGGPGGTVRGLRAGHRRSGARAAALGLPETAGAELVARYRAGGDGGGGGADSAGSGAGAGSAGSGGTTVPRQLPSGVAHFAGRGAELAALDAVLDGGTAGGPGVVISA